MIMYRLFSSLVNRINQSDLSKAQDFTVNCLVFSEIPIIFSLISHKIEKIQQMVRDAVYALKMSIYQ